MFHNIIFQLIWCLRGKDWHGKDDLRSTDAAIEDYRFGSKHADPIPEGSLARGTIGAVPYHICGMPCLLSRIGAL